MSQRPVRPLRNFSEVVVLSVANFLFSFLVCLGAVDDLAIVLKRRGRRLVDRKRQPLTLHNEGIAIPLVDASSKEERTAELLFVAGDLAGLGLA